jgi:hypothetical protein
MAAKLPGTPSFGLTVARPRRLVVAREPATLTLAPPTGRPRRFTVTFTFGVRLVAFGERVVTRRPRPAQRPAAKWSMPTLGPNVG